ncbi:MAG: Lar family restriction alleviation protein [Burkholderiaceae bacterium]|jgi:hypothetical protein|nr:Lar family restriction alleviation protein [Burkholderiaceae bacterium]
MPPILHIQSALIRRCCLILLMPMLFPLIFFLRIGKAMMSAFTEFAEMFSAIWKGMEEEAPLLPCPFCGGRGMPHGWRTQGGATGPACDNCGATAWSTDTWNTRIPLTEEQMQWMRDHQEEEA